MSGEIHPDEADRALAEISHRHGQVVALMDIPWWYWWAIALLMVLLGVVVDAHRTAALGIGIPVFVVGVLLATGRVALRGVPRVRPRRDLVDPAGVLAVLAFVAVTVGASLACAFVLRDRGASHPGTWGDLLGAVVMVGGGPLLNRFLRHRMLRNRVGVR